MTACLRRPASRICGSVLLLVIAVVDGSGWAQTPTASAVRTRRAAKPVVSEYAPNVPQVFLSAQHAQMCRVLVGDEFPAIELPQLGSGPTKLSSFAGQRATVVLFWRPDHWMSRVALADIANDVAARARDASIGVVGVVEDSSPDSAQQALAQSGAKFSQLLDADREGLAQVGSGALPRIYVFDANHRIAWFDVEYSEATRRELQQTLAALAAAK